MCGFTGYINKKEKDDKIIEAMSERIVHRGPDSDGYYKVEANLYIMKMKLK